MGAAGLERGRAMVFRRLALTAVGELLLGLEYPIEGGFRGDVQALVSERRDDLAWRLVGKFRSVGKLQKARALLLRKRVGRRAPWGGGLAPIGFDLPPGCCQRCRVRRLTPSTSQAWCRRAPAAQASSSRALTWRRSERLT
jgi:hypothetical protein